MTDPQEEGFLFAAPPAAAGEARWVPLGIVSPPTGSQTTIIDRSTCGDPEGLGAGCEGGRWYAPCGDPRCFECGEGIGMCVFLGPCECLGCEYTSCCAGRHIESSHWMWGPSMWVYDPKLGREVNRPIVDGPSI